MGDSRLNGWLNLGTPIEYLPYSFGVFFSMQQFSVEGDMQQGYIRLYRCMMDKGWSRDPDYIALWIHLLMRANYRCSEVLMDNKINHLLPGQFITSRPKLCVQTGIERNKIERILKLFESEHQIEQQTFTKYRIITILNWQKFQSREQEIEPQVSSKRAASEQQVSTDNKGKKEKNIKPYPLEFEKFWSTYPKKIGKDKALESWQKKNPPLEKVLETLAWQIPSEQWMKESGQFIPLPTTYINQGRWNDEPTQKQPTLAATPEWY